MGLETDAILAVRIRVEQDNLHRARREQAIPQQPNVGTGDEKVSFRNFAYEFFSSDDFHNPLSIGIIAWIAAGN